MNQTAEEWPSPRAEQAHPDIAAVRAKMTDLEQETRTLIRQRPVVAVLAAAAFGYLVARVVVRGTK